MADYYKLKCNSIKNYFIKNCNSWILSTNINHHLFNTEFIYCSNFPRWQCVGVADWTTMRGPFKVTYFLLCPPLGGSAPPPLLRASTHAHYTLCPYMKTHHSGHLEISHHTAQDIILPLNQRNSPPQCALRCASGASEGRLLFLYLFCCCNIVIRLPWCTSLLRHTRRKAAWPSRAIGAY